MLLQATNIKKYFGTRLVLDIERLSIYEGARIGLIGPNGGGKTTLLRILAQEEETDEGQIDCSASVAVVRQIETEHESVLSGGERTKEKIHRAIALTPMLLLADEPDNHLDRAGIRYLIKRLTSFEGAFVLVSHDRTLLNAVCGQIWALKNGRLSVFPGNYDDYKDQKERETLETSRAYEQYAKEKKRLERTVHRTRRSSEAIKKAPSRMGNSEARLHKMGDQHAKANLDKAAKRLRVRLEQMQAVEKPHQDRNMAIALHPKLALHQPVLVQASGLTECFGDRILFENASFSLKNHAKTALIGANGSGKSTLLNMIANRDDRLSFAHNLKIGFFHQFFAQLRLEETILENVNRISAFHEEFNRTILARMLFRRDTVYQRCHTLSGGERNRVCLAMLITSPANLLLLDEPTNHMDLTSIEAVESALRQYQGTILFVSHDERFIASVATDCLEISKKRIREERLN